MPRSSLILAAVWLLAGAAAAQSSVTIYGVIDMGIAHGNGGTAGNSGGAPGTPLFTGSGKLWGVQQAAASRLGFRGNEDLGGGLSAQFELQHRFTPDDGVSATPFWAGKSIVQLTSASLGSIYFGRDYVPAFYLAVKTDPFTYDGVGSLSAMQFARYAAPANPFGGARTSNGFGYKSPRVGGVTLQFSQGLSEDTGVGRENGIGLDYTVGRLSAGLAWDKVIGGTNNGTRLLSIGATYDIGVAKLMAYHAQSKVLPANNGHTGSVLEGNRVSVLSALAPVGVGNVKFVAARLETNGDNPNGTSNELTKFAIGYDNFLSKRTNLYGDLAVTRGGIRSAASIARQLAENSTNTTFAVGVKHVF